MKQDAWQKETLELFAVPAFSVQNDRIAERNAAAEALLLEPGTPVLPLLASGREEYQRLEGGCLFLTLELLGLVREAVVHCREDCRIFLVEESREPGLELLGLAATSLRGPLSDVMTVTDQLFPVLANLENPDLQRQLAQMNRGLYRLLRTVGNMADAESYLSESLGLRLEPTELGSFLGDIYEKSKTLTQSSGVSLSYRCPEGGVFGNVDRQRLERAVYNLLSNALKFTAPGDSISMTLTRREQIAIIKVTDNGQGLGEGMDTVLSRFRRAPGLEEPRNGIGLGLPMAARIAALHGGALLLQRGEPQGTVAALSLRLDKAWDPEILTPCLWVDYAGEHDHGLVELAEGLPWEVFHPKHIN